MRVELVTMKGGVDCGGRLAEVCIRQLRPRRSTTGSSSEESDGEKRQEEIREREICKRKKNEERNLRERH